MIKFSRSRYYLTHLVVGVAQVILVFFFIKFFVVDVGKVDGVSMDPTLYDGQLFAVDHATLLYRTPERGDIVQIRHPDDEHKLVVKRIVGLAGETISFKAGEVYIDGELFEEEYLSIETRTLIDFGFSNSTLVPEGAFFVLGDNRLHSTDSRHYGVVPRELVMGVVRSIN